MKSNSTGTSNSTKSNSSSGKSKTAANKKSGMRSMDSTPSTESVRGKHTHGHGMSNEGTNTDYEEQR
jgi:hypothetical protein